jgi:VanZ family protein
MPALDLKRSQFFTRGGPGTVSSVERSVRGQIFGWGPVVLWAAVLFLLSELQWSGRDLPIGSDKLAHGGLYLILGLSLGWGRRSAGSSVPWVTMLLVGVGYGALDEWHQSFVPGRDVSVGDWVADGAGVLLGLVLFSRFYRVGGNESSPSPVTPTAGSL